MIIQNSEIKSQNYNSKFKSSLNDRCYQMSLEVIKLADELPNKQSARIISHQVIRSICSVGANLIEAKASSSRLEFKKFNEISLKSANESKYWLGLLKDSELADANRIDILVSELEEISNMIASGIIKLKGGRKF